MITAILMTSVLLIAGQVQSCVSSTECLERAAVHCNDTIEVQNSSFVTSHDQNLTLHIVCNEQLEELHQDTFLEFNETERINIIYNPCIEEIPSKIFEKNQNLLYLNLSNNCLETLPGDVFYQLQKLVVLDLSHNRLLYVERSTFMLPKLKSLRLDHNVLTSLSEDIFVELVSLRHLDLSHNKLHILASSLFKAQEKLVHLNLEWNRIISVSFDLMPLKHLRSLRLNGNPIKPNLDQFMRMRRLNSPSNSHRRTPECNCMLKALWDEVERREEHFVGDLMCLRNDEMIFWSSIEDCNTPKSSNIHLYILLLLLFCGLSFLGLSLVCYFAWQYSTTSEDTKSTISEIDSEFQTTITYSDSLDYITPIVIGDEVKSDKSAYAIS